MDSINMRKTKYIGMFITIISLLFLSGCNNDEFNYIDSGYDIGDYNVYYREYSNQNDCSNFDVFILFSNQLEGKYHYIDAIKSNNGNCSSGYFIKNEDLEEQKSGIGGLGMELNDGYVTVYSSTLSFFNINQIEEFSNNFDLYPVDMTLQMELSLEARDVTLEIALKQRAYYYAQIINSDLNRYCNLNNCVNNLEIEWDDITIFTYYLDIHNLYNSDFNNGVAGIYTDAGIELYIDSLKVNDFEFPSGEIWRNLEYTDMVYDPE